LICFIHSHVRKYELQDVQAAKPDGIAAKHVKIVEPSKAEDTNEDVGKAEYTNEDVDKNTSSGESLLNYFTVTLYFISFSMLTHVCYFQNLMVTLIHNLIQRRICRSPSITVVCNTHFFFQIFKNLVI
jgi:uncharacterized phosphosugar-binding protein